VRSQPVRLARIDRDLDRGDELMASIREELRLNREAYERHFELSRREHQATQAALETFGTSAGVSSPQSMTTHAPCATSGPRSVLRNKS
jgi:hypothetical protein